MNRTRKILLFGLFLTWFIFMIGLGFSAYATISKVEISMPSSATVGQSVQVQTAIHTVASG